jgi:DNA-binding transcriptional ArsR family regulator
MESRQALAVEPVRGGGAGASMTAAAEVFKAVAHPVRAQILELLSRCESSHLSRHLTQMRGQHLIQCRWIGGRPIYRLAYPEVFELLSAARSILQARTAAAASSLAPRRSLCTKWSLEPTSLRFLTPTATRFRCSKVGDLETSG